MNTLPHFFHFFNIHVFHLLLPVKTWPACSLVLSRADHPISLSTLSIQLSTDLHHSLTLLSGLTSASQLSWQLHTCQLFVDPSGTLASQSFWKITNDPKFCQPVTHRDEHNLDKASEWPMTSQILTTSSTRPIECFLPVAVFCSSPAHPSWKLLFPPFPAWTPWPAVSKLLTDPAFFILLWVFLG